MLEKELAYYEKILENWLSLYSGKFVLVKGEELVGVYDSTEIPLRYHQQLR